MTECVEDRQDRPACPISGSTDWRPFCRQTGPDGRVWDWIEFPETGFVRLSEMPSAMDLVRRQDAHGNRYIEEQTAKWNSKRRRSRSRARYLRKALTTGTRVLDVGSNVGLFCEACAQLGLNPTGLEVSGSLVEFARERFPEIPFHISTFESFETDDSFDGIYCSEVIEHSSDPEAFGRKLNSLLKPGGVLYLTTPGLNEYLDRAGKPARYLGAPDHRLYFDRTNIDAFLKACGFSDVRHKPGLKPMLGLKSGIQVIARR